MLWKQDKGIAWFAVAFNKNSSNQGDFWEHYVVDSDEGERRTAS